MTAAGAPPATHVVHAQIEARGCTAELYLNDIPVSRIHPGRTAFESVAVEQLLVPGKNRIEVLVEPGSRPSRARLEARDLPAVDFEAIGRLVRLPDGEFTDPENGEVLAEARAVRPPDTTGVLGFPRSAIAEVDLGAAHGRWAFLDAPLLVLDDALVAEAGRVLDEIARAYRDLSAPRLWALSELHIRDSLRAYPAVSEASLRADLEEILAHYGRVADRVVPRDESRHDFRLVGGGRLVECVDDDWAPSLRLRDPDDGSAVPHPVLLARIDGRLRVVR